MPSSRRRLPNSTITFVCFVYHRGMCTLVYTHHRADTGAIFYVGIGSIARAKARAARSALWKRIEAKYGRVVNIVGQFPTREGACAMECFLIGSWRDSGAFLANHTSGGESGHEFDDDTRARMSESLAAACKRKSTIEKKAATMATAEYKSRMASSVSSARAKPSTKEKYTKYHLSNEYKAMAAIRNSIPIIRSDGVRFISTNNAARHMGVSDAAIGSVLCGATKTCRGFGWRYDGESGRVDRSNQEDGRPNVIIRSDGVAFKSLSDAASSVSVKSNAISYAIKSGSTKTGYGWAFASDLLRPGRDGRRKVTRGDGVEFDSITDAASSCGVDVTMVSRALNGKAKTAGGHTWSFSQ
jgi:hypothetical protein